jgi:hypothetical protein
VLATALDVVGAEIRDVREARWLDHRRPAARRALPVRLRHLEQDAAHCIVDLLVVLVLVVAEALQDRSLADLVQEVRVSERDHERNHERHGAVGISFDGDPLGGKTVFSWLSLNVPAGTVGSNSPWTMLCAR